MWEIGLILLRLGIIGEPLNAALNLRVPLSMELFIIIIIIFTMYSFSFHFSGLFFSKEVYLQLFKQLIGKGRSNHLIVMSSGLNDTTIVAMALAK